MNHLDGGMNLETRSGINKFCAMKEIIFNSPRGGGGIG